MTQGADSVSASPPAPPRLGLAITSLVFGILACILSFLLVGLIAGAVGVLLGVLHVRRAGVGKTMARWGVGLSLAGIVASAGFGVLYYQAYKHIKEIVTSQQSDGDANDWQGVLAPDITLTTLDGDALRLSDLRGRRVVLDFWATWCGPCVREIPHFIQLHNETSRDDLVIVGISKESEDKLKSFVRDKGVNYPIVSARELPAPFGDIKAIPTTFFIDRQGVIQSVVVGYHDLEHLKELALAEDHPGTPLPAPAPRPSNLRVADNPLTATQVWSVDLPGAEALCASDWDGNGVHDILVAQGRTLRVLDMHGVELMSIPLPDAFSMIEAGRHQTEQVRLLGYSNWGREVSVMDGAGRQLWSVTAPFGVDGAHWGDLDGDGTDELIVGMNGSGGLRVYAADGKEMWAVKLGNVWNQAVISAAENRPALVFATEAGGTVRVFDTKGRPLRTIRPGKQYSAQMTATVVDSANAIQAIAIAGGDAVAFDETGREAWSTPSIHSAGAWRKTTFAHGDLDGDGIANWVFHDPAGALVIATPGGERVASLPDQSGLDDFVVIPARDGRGLLITLASNTLRAYLFQ